MILAFAGGERSYSTRIWRIESRSAPRPGLAAVSGVDPTTASGGGGGGGGGGTGGGGGGGAPAAEGGAGAGGGGAAKTSDVGDVARQRADLRLLRRRFSLG